MGLGGCCHCLPGTSLSPSNSTQRFIPSTPVGSAAPHDTEPFQIGPPDPAPTIVGDGRKCLRTVRRDSRCVFLIYYSGAVACADDGVSAGWHVSVRPNTVPWTQNRLTGSYCTARSYTIKTYSGRVHDWWSLPVSRTINKDASAACFLTSLRLVFISCQYIRIIH